ncbi:hypothetical protein BDY19DRAFT_357173 [Irpex rosettiformis]|uniref:Uncharacterized protein n=1 Tax=Irpex rosettiformis TaxID=378272 RepID=A0ACB8TWQ1_9APHY|nr:hypothetical protein BDY19DRAFT_357173 [Irpex rosettiformis]
MMRTSSLFFGGGDDGRGVAIAARCMWSIVMGVRDKAVDPFVASGRSTRSDVRWWQMNKKCESVGGFSSKNVFKRANDGRSAREKMEAPRCSGGRQRQSLSLSRGDKVASKGSTTTTTANSLSQTLLGGPGGGYSIKATWQAWWRRTDCRSPAATLSASTSTLMQGKPAMGTM